VTTYRLFPATDGPSSVTGTTGDWLLGVMFSTLGAMSWFDGYWAWVPADGDTTPRKCAVWNIYSTSAQQVVSGSVVTSGTLTAGQWNFIPLGTPIQLAPGTLYCAAQGWTVTSGIPVTGSQFGGGQPLASGVTSGPLTAWSSLGGSNEFPAASLNQGHGQMLFSNALGADPSAAIPNNGSGDDNLWVDVQLSDTAPSGYTGSYRLYPNMTDLGNFSLDTANGFTLGKQFSLSEQCDVNNVWFYSPATVTQLPAEVGVYRISDQSLVLSESSPTWSGAAGSGWISAPLSGSLDAGTDYKVVVFQGSNVIWNAAVANYYSTGFGGSGLTSGPISVPGNASAASPGQETYHQAAAIAYPDTSAGPFAYGLDIEVTPVTADSGTAAVTAHKATLAASGSESVTGSAAVAAHKARLSGSGTESDAGSAAVRAHKARVAASGTESVSGTGAVRAAKARLSGVQAGTVTGTAAVRARKARVSGGTAAPLTGFPDIPHAVCDLLASLANGADIETPADLQSQVPWIRVTRTGGQSDLITDTASLVVDVFASGATEGATIAEKIRQRLITGPFRSDVSFRTNHGQVDRAFCSVGPTLLPPTDSDNLRLVTASYNVSMRR